MKKLSENILIDYLGSLGTGFPPVEVRTTKMEPGAGSEDRLVDAIVEGSWQTKRFLFAVKTNILFTPKAIEESIQEAETISRQLGMSPMIVTPYLSEERLQELASKNVSGLDLCGNGIIVVPKEMLIYRTGNPNRYPSSTPIRNVYRGTSSIVARSFLLRPSYDSAQDLLDEILARSGTTTLSTVSKVCSSLGEELIVERQRRGKATRFFVLQPEKLLDQLAAGYDLPEPQTTVRGKLTCELSTFTNLLRNWQKKNNEQAIRTGAASCEAYATMARESVTQYYCTDVEGLLKSLGDGFRQTDRFAEVELLETDDPAVYFDPRKELMASPIQAYLELMLGDKRERETANQIRQKILGDLKGRQEAQGA